MFRTVLSERFVQNRQRDRWVWVDWGMNKAGKAISALCLAWFGVPLLALAAIALLVVLAGIVAAIASLLGFDILPVPD